MYKIDTETKQIELTRGDRFSFTIKNKTGNFSKGDKFKFSIGNKKDYQNVLFQKDYTLTEDSNSIVITMSSDETRFDEPIDRQKDYWYELEYNGISTLLGYDEDRDKILTLYPESADKESDN